MELKQEMRIGKKILMNLLIVPYGIETFVNSITFVSAFVF